MCNTSYHDVSTGTLITYVYTNKQQIRNICKNLHKNLQIKVDHKIKLFSSKIDKPIPKILMISDKGRESTYVPVYN